MRHSLPVLAIFSVDVLFISRMLSKLKLIITATTQNFFELLA